MLAKIKMIEEGGRLQLPDEHRLRAQDREYFSQAYGRLHRHGIAQTITPHFDNPGSGRFIHYRDHRALTVREAARFQNFDDDFMFLGHAEWQMRHVGNAVPVLLGKAIASECATALPNGCGRDNRGPGCRLRRRHFRPCYPEPDDGGRSERTNIARAAPSARNVDRGHTGMATTHTRGWRKT